MKRQQRQTEWHYQWENFHDDEAFLFFDWIQPRTLEDFAGRRVLDAGCGPGHHVRRVATVADHVVALDLNAADLARDALASFRNVEVVEDDLALYAPTTPFDVVYSIGVIDHTDDPDRSFAHLVEITRPGGLVIVWVWSAEGNRLMERIVEPVRARFLRRRSRRFVATAARVLTAALYPVVHTVYRLPVRSLPYFEYFENFRKLSFDRNALNTFDKLNAPYTEFISRARIGTWFDPAVFEDVAITHYRGVSWCASGRKQPTTG